MIYCRKLITLFCSFKFKIIYEIDISFSFRQHKTTLSCFKVTISSLDDLAKQTDTKYSVVQGSGTETYFKHMAKIEETFYNNWKTMSLGSTSPNTADKSSQYAVWDYPLGDKFTIIWNRMKETGLLNSSEEGVQKVSISCTLFHFHPAECSFQSLESNGQM